MNRPVFLVIVLIAASLISACQPATPTPPAPTITPTSVPTVNFRATEAVIISHVFATMTAVAPTRVPPPPPATATPVRPTVAPAKPKVATSVPAPVTAATPKPTTDPYVAQLPAGMGGILIVNYFGNREVVFNIASTTHTVKANDRAFIAIAPGRYNYSLSVPGAPDANRSDILDVLAGRYTTFTVLQPQ